MFKSALPSLLSHYQPRGMAIDGALWWPVSPLGLLQLYLSSPEHCRACHVKAAGAYGRGMVFAGDADARRFGDLCERGPADLWVDCGLDAEVYGNDWVETVRTPAGRLLALAHRPAVTIQRLVGGGAIQRIWEGSRETVTRFAPTQIQHYRPPCPGGGYYAYPTWYGAAGMADLADAAVRYNQSFFANAAIPEYAIITKGFELSQSQKDATKEFFCNSFRGLDKAHRTLYLHLPDKEHEIEFRRVSAEAKDGDFIKLLDASRDRLPVAHGTPPRILGIVAAGQLGGGSEATAQNKQFEDLTLIPMRARRLNQLRPIFRELGIRPENAQFVPLDLTPPDTDADNLAEWVAAGILTPDEARAVASAGGALPALKSAGGTPGRPDLTALARLLERL